MTATSQPDAPFDPAPDSLAVCGELRRLVAVVDSLWNRALRSASERSVVLGEASHGLHRALIALEEVCGRGWDGNAAA